MDTNRWARELRNSAAALLVCSLGLAVSSCEQPSKDGTTVEPPVTTVDAIRSVTLLPGESLGPFRLGATMGQVKDLVGEPDRAIGFRRTMTLTYFAFRLEIVVTTRQDQVVDDDSVVVAIGTLPGAILEGPLAVGDSADSAASQFGEPAVVAGEVVYHPEAGLGLEVDSDGVIRRVAVWRPFSPDIEPPEMEAPAGEATTRAGDIEAAAEAPWFEYQGQRYEVVDAHLHTGKIQSQLPDGMAFLVSQIPALARLYFPGTAPQVLSPYDSYLGIKEHAGNAGVAHAVLLATYTQHTVGYASNREIEEILTDPRNVRSNGRPWAWGMASLNYEGFDDPTVAAQRLERLGQYFERYPDLFIGIKLAHAHQAVSFEDPIYLGVYDVAAAHQVPVLLHTGFSPFPNTRTEPEFYDPASLEAVVQAFDGQHGQGRVEFVLSHIGQGDARAIEHSLSLAERYDNVWFELSAINRPLLIDAAGLPTDDPTLMHDYVLEAIRDRGLVDRLIFGSDGPQYFGKLHAYLNLMAETMSGVGYTVAEMRRVFSENFYRCFSLD
jgi:uncharacterized protein